MVECDIEVFECDVEGVVCVFEEVCGCVMKCRVELEDLVFVTREDGVVVRDCEGVMVVI